MICNFPKVSLRWNYYYTYTPYYWTQNWPTIMFLDLLPFKCSLRGFVGTQAFNIVIDNTPYYWKSESKMPLHTLIIKPIGLKFWRFALQVFVNIDVMFLCLIYVSQTLQGTKQSIAKGESHSRDKEAREWRATIFIPMG